MNIKKTIAVTLALLGLGALSAQAVETLTGQEVMEKNFYVTKIKAYRADSTMVLINANGEKRERKLKTISKLQENGIDSKLIAKFLEPADVRGTGFLQVEHIDGDDDQWIFLPALQKSRRLVANNKKDSFFGSDFSYGDISLPKVEAYKHKLTGFETIDGTACFVEESVPATNQLKEDTGYSKKISWIREDNFIEAKVDYYDLNGQLFKTQTTSDYQQVSSKPERWLALHREMDNVQTGHKTFFDLSHVDIKSPVDDGLFTTRSLERP